jgi:cytochrome P450
MPGSKAPGCPVVTYDHTALRPIMGHFAELDDLRAGSPVWWNELEPGFWMFTTHDLVQEALQTPAIFSSESQSVFHPDPPQRFIPTHLDPPAHGMYRRVLNPLFTPRAVEKLRPMASDVCARLIGEIAPRGHCDFMAAFGLEYPTEVFLRMVGLPVADAPSFLKWVETFFVGHYGTDKQPIIDAAASIKNYFADVVADRRQHPREPNTDFVTYLLQSTVDDRPLSDEEVLDICFVLVLAGLDTTKSQMGYLMYQLATHPEDRRRLVAHRELIPNAVEESLRASSIIAGVGRKVAADTDFHGCPLKMGDMVLLSVAAANRDPNVFDRPGAFLLERGPTRHLGFIVGPHRCLGAHLARAEMAVLLEEWHRRIPDYRLADGTDMLERGGGFAPLTLPLVWDA